MDNYTKQLEEQNEELKQKLAGEQAKVNDMSFLYNLSLPRWNDVSVPVRNDCKDTREGHVYNYGGSLSTYAVVEWDSGNQAYCVKWYIPCMSFDTVCFESIKDAKDHVEDRFKFSINELKKIAENNNDI